MLKTRQLLLENFDEAVQERLKLRQSESLGARDRYERWLMDLTRAVLLDHATFDDWGFDLHALPPAGLAPQAELGRYDWPHHGGSAHLYRIGHPLAQALIEHAKTRRLPTGRLRLDYLAYGTRLSTLEPLRGTSGWLSLSVLTVHAMGTAEDHLLLAAVDGHGQPLPAEDANKLLRLPATSELPDLLNHAPPQLQEALESQRRSTLAAIDQRNLGYFEAEVQKLDAWADDLKSGLETAVKELDRDIKEVRRTAAVAATLEEKLHWQKKQKELEDKRSQLRRRIFDRQDDIDLQRSTLIQELEGRLSQEVQEVEVFALAWELV